MKSIILLILGVMILTQSCNNPNREHDSVKLEKNSVIVTVDSTPWEPIQEEIVRVDTAKKSYDGPPTKEKVRRQKEIYDPIFGGEYYKIGAKSADVIKIEGQPTSVSVIGPYKTFYYRRNSLRFYNSRLQDYDNTDGRLKVKIEE